MMLKCFGHDWAFSTAFHLILWLLNFSKETREFSAVVVL